MSARLPQRRGVDSMGKLNGLGRNFFSSMLKGAKRTDALRKRRLERALKEQGYSNKEAKHIVAIQNKQ